jgi:gluconate kinase
VLRAHERDPRITDDERIVWLRAMIDALGQPRSRAERHLVVKFDAWHALHIDLIERAFPGVPWVFLVRDPVEVLVSHQRQISWMMAALNAPSLLECTPVEAMRLPRDEYHARVLARIATAMAAHGAAERTIDYRALPGAVWQTIAPHFGIALSSADDERLRAAVTRDAKQPTRAFTADAADKQDEADAELREYAARWLAEPYARLTDQNERGIPRTC